jgi:hypothetical protein
MSTPDLTQRALEALYDRARSPLGTTAGLMMSGNDVLDSYHEAIAARNALLELGVDPGHPCDDPWVAAVVSRARKAVDEGRGDIHYGIGPGTVTSRDEPGDADPSF